jgi:hypothetical protein
MSDVKASLFSRLNQLLSATFPASEKLAESSRDDDRPTLMDAERRLFEREESFYWTWQYPGQW